MSKSLSIKSSNQNDILLGASLTAVTGGTIYGLYTLYKCMMKRNRKYKLIYFNLRGLAEVSRYMFAIAGVEYEDYRYPISFNPTIRKEWDAAKSSYLYEKIPELHVCGKVISQSKAIERYLAGEFGLMGRCAVESAQIDAASEQLRDVKDAYNKAKSVKDTQPESLTKFFNNDLSAAFRLYANAQTDSGYLVGNQTSLTDIQLFSWLSELDDQQSVNSTLAAYPTIAAVKDRVASIPAIVAWIKKRPITSM